LTGFSEQESKEGQQIRSQEDIFLIFDFLALLAVLL
jgi:hypothetical protein